MIGKFIQEMREENGLSQEYMANKLGISRPTYISIEKDQRDVTIQEVTSIAKLLNLSVGDLIVQRRKTNSVEVVKTNSIKEQEHQIRINIPQRNFDKFREILLYVLSKVGAKPNVGETVLYKLLYFIDFDYYEKYEEQLIGATYIKNHFGPTPIEFKKLIEDMIDKNELEIVKSKYFHHEQKKYLAVRNPDLSKSVTGRELQHIEEVLARLANKNATELSDYSHQDVPWIITEEGKPIDYESVFYRTPKTSVRNYEGSEL